MGKSPIPKMDYVMDFIRWVTLRASILPEVSILSIYLCVIPVEAYTGRVGCRADDFKGDSPFIRYRRSPRFRDPLPNLFQFQDLLLNCSFNEYSQYYALKRTRTSTLFSTRF